jgi:hypothetical protein
LLESEAPKALAAFAHSWSDLPGLTIVPVLEDQELSEVLRRASARPARAEAYPEDSPVVPETTPGQTKPPYEEIA